MTMTREERVAEFYRAADTGTVSEGGSFGMFITCFSEELSEFNESMADYLSTPSEETRANMIKEWADVQYVLSGLAYFFEFDGDKAFNIVADNNMTKVGVDGKVTKREDGKILKPEGYKKPDMKGL